MGENCNLFFNRESESQLDFSVVFVSVGCGLKAKRAFLRRPQMKTINQLIDSLICFTDDIMLSIKRSLCDLRYILSALGPDINKDYTADSL